MANRMPILGATPDAIFRLLEAVVDSALEDMMTVYRIASRPPHEDEVMSHLDTDETTGVDLHSITDEVEDLHASLVETRREVADDYSAAIERLQELKLLLVREENQKVCELLRTLIAEETASVADASRALASKFTPEALRVFERKYGASGKLLQAFLDALEA